MREYEVNNLSLKNKEIDTDYIKDKNILRNVKHTHLENLRS